MGWFMQQHDIYVGSILDELNLRFAPSQGDARLFGGVEEMAALQKEFKIFKTGRSFRASVAVLNIGARNAEAKNRWLDYLDSFPKLPSNQGAQNADVAVVRALKKNLESAKPLPVYFTSHDMRESNQVKVTEQAQPVHYLQQDYVVISMPMQPLQVNNAALKKRATASAKTAKAAKPAAKKNAK